MKNKKIKILGGRGGGVFGFGGSGWMCMEKLVKLL